MRNGHDPKVANFTRDQPLASVPACLGAWRFVSIVSSRRVRRALASALSTSALMLEVPRGE
jgi:hypothetical protein